MVPHSLRVVPGAGAARRPNPEDDDPNPRRRGKTMTPYELWENRQLVASGVLDVREYGQYDEESGLGVLGGAHEDNVEEFEIDLNDNEPEFLKVTTD